MNCIYISTYVPAGDNESTVIYIQTVGCISTFVRYARINHEWKIKARFKNCSQVIWKDAGGGNDFSGASVLPDYQVSRFFSHCFSSHHPGFLRIKRSKKGDFTLTITLKCCTNAERLSDGLRTMALRNLSSEALSNERVGYYSAVEYSLGWDKNFSRPEHRSLQRNESNFSHCSSALIFLWLLSLHQGKESDNYPAVGPRA